MRCYFLSGENVCKRCRSGKHDCIVEGRNPDVSRSEPTPFLSFPSGVHLCLGDLVLLEIILLRTGPPPTCPPSLKILDRAVSHPPSACTPVDDDECSLSPFSKREYLLAQVKQKDELIDSLLEQVRLSHAISAKCMHFCSSCYPVSLLSFIMRTSPRLSRSGHTATQRLLLTNTDKT